MNIGSFITFEGGEGSGKSTQVKILAHKLRSFGLNVRVTREPGGTDLAERLRSLLLDPSLKVHSVLCEALLFFAARADHLHEIIRPALQNGDIVICDRFSDSTRVYQGYAGKLNLELIKSLEQIVVGLNVPDVTIIVDLPAKIGLERIKVRKLENVYPVPKTQIPQTHERGSQHETDRYEAREIEYHEKLRQGYLNIALLEPKRCVVIDGQDTIDNVSAAVWKVIEERILKRYS